MSEIGEKRFYLNRREAAAFITQRWFVISASTLARYASEDRGPPYKLGSEGEGRALYTRKDLDAWAGNTAAVAPDGPEPVTAPAPAQPVGALRALGGRS